MAEKRKRISKPSPTIEGREDELISLAFDAIEKRIRDGTATGGELIHFAKLGSTKERLEKEIMEHQKELIEAKTDALKTQKSVEELYSKALDAMKSYGGMRDD